MDDQTALQIISQISGTAERIAVLEAHNKQIILQIAELKRSQEKHEDRTDNDKSKKTTRNFAIISIIIAVCSLIIAFLNLLNNVKWKP